MTIAFRAFVLTAIIAACSSPSTAAASLVTVSYPSPGGNVFLLQGADLAGVAGIDITLRYDAAALKNPRVENGPLVAGAMTAVNANAPGVVRIAIISLSPISGSGIIATLSFEGVGNASNPITGLSVKFIDSNGSALPANAQVQMPGASSVSAEAEQASGQTQEPQASSVASSHTALAIPPAPAQPATVVPPVIAPGMVVTPSEANTPPKDAQPSLPSEREQLARDTSIAKADEGTRKAQEKPAPSGPESTVVLTQKSVLDRFREYRGARTQKALTALFDQEMLIGCRQDPPIVLSDGKATAAVTFIAPADLKGSPDIALIGATLVSLARHRDNTNTWVAVVRPQRNVFEAKMTVPLSGRAMVIPITVAPRADVGPKKKGRLTDSDFNSYLKGSGGRSPKRGDVNGDGKTDFLDDYIFTANFLARR